jgi:hypothetical protein
MSIQFYTINNNDKKLNLVRALIGREQEIHSYDTNIANYEAMLTSLPTGEWPDLISAYKNTPIELVPSDLHQSVTDYSFRDRLRALLATEKLERSKSVRIYEAIVAQLPAEEIPTLIAEVLASQ